MMNDVSSGAVGASGAVVKKHVYTVTERNERSFWTKIGVAFVNRDGSLTVRLEAFPCNGMLQIRDDEFGARARGAGGAT
jgi:hypothetical protein